MRVITLIVALALAQLTSAQTPTEITAKMPQIEGWNIVEEKEIFHSENLYDKINGAAPGYILFDFKELTALEYNKDVSGEELPPYISVQVYRHGSHTDAFGIYASERPQQTNFLTIGAEGYQEGSIFNFFVDNLYVKIESPHDDDEIVKIIRKIAQEFGRNVNTNPVFPSILKNFPDENKIARSEIYIPSGFLGHEFLSNAFTATYIVSGKKYQLFIIDAGSAARANTMLNNYIQFTKQRIRLREGRLKIEDRFNGNIECQWKGQYIVGVVNDNNIPLKIDELLKETSKNL